MENTKLKLKAALSGPGTHRHGDQVPTAFPRQLGIKTKQKIIVFSYKMEIIKVAAQLESRGMKTKNWFGICSELRS